MEVIIVGALVFGVAYAITHRGSNRTSEDNWRPSAVAAPAVANIGAQIGSRAGTQRGAAVQLARIEGRHLLRNELFIVGIFMSVAILVVFGVIWAPDNLGARNSWRHWLALLPVFSLSFAGMTLMAVNAGALRSRRDDVDELFVSLPASDAARVCGHIGSTWMAVLVQALFVTAYVAEGTFVNHHFGRIDSASIGDVVVSFVLVVCACSLAVALARWLPKAIVGIAALVILAIVSTIIGGIGGRHWSMTRQLSLWPRYPDHDWMFAVRPSWWHALYLLALGTLMAVVAVARSRRDRAVTMAAALALLIAAVGGFAQTRPMSATTAERLAAMVADPVAHSTCTSNDGLTMCSYTDYAEIADNWARDLSAPFAAVAPQQRATGFTVLWREPRLDRLDPRVQANLDTDALAQAWESDSSTLNGVAIDGTESVDTNRLSLGLWSAGLPLRAAQDGMPCAAGGQAQGLVALWVAVQGESSEWATRFYGGSWTGINDPDRDYRFPASWKDGHLWSADAVPPVLWSASDMIAAQAIVQLEVDRVRDVLWADWSHWTDAATTSDELLSALGLASAGVPVAPEGVVACR